ncbi:complement C5-like [Diceros bicornis minor]|uniref:complement C5-like n=1 Tax=Diceros bicornis minor TaxID=77932 RepID=UPI0026F30894|nr:complement C5-like [Diceros bicornis minor]
MWEAVPALFDERRVDLHLSQTFELWAAEADRVNLTTTPPDLSNIYKISSSVSSIFLGNWLWKVYHVPKRRQLELMLPDFLTTWEIQGIGISNKGLCVADVLQLQVYKDHFLAINNNVPRVD